MRAVTAILLCVVLFMTGCANPNAPIDNALKLRNEIESANGCAFAATVTADYGENVYVFSMDCTTDKEGNLSFTVTAPDTISGITGKISAGGGTLTFDDKVLAFQTMADGVVTPVTAPWILMKTLKSGYLKSCAENDTGFEISADDSYAEGSLHLNIAAKDNLPSSAEIFWNGRRILTVSVENFRYL